VDRHDPLVLREQYRDLVTWVAGGGALAR